MSIEIVRSDSDYDEYVRARNHLENRGFFYFSCNVDDWLKQHDDGLAIWKNSRTNKYRVTGDKLWTIMEFDGVELDYRIVERVKRVDSRRGYSAIAELRENDEAQERAFERATDDIAYNLAKDTRRMVSRMD